MARLTAKTRSKIATGKFALPGRRFPVHDRQHAATAKSYASRMVKRGQLSPGEKATIDRRANAVLGRTGKALGGAAQFRADTRAGYKPIGMSGGKLIMGRRKPGFTPPKGGGLPGFAIGGKVFNDWDLTDQSAAKRAAEFRAAPSRQGLYNSGAAGGISVGGGTLGVGSYGLPGTGAARSPAGGQPTTPRGTPTPLATTSSAGGAPSIHGRVAAAMPKDERVGQAFGYRQGGSVKRMKLAGGGMGDSGRGPAAMKKQKGMRMGYAKGGRMKLAGGGPAIVPGAFSGDRPEPRLRGNASYGNFSRFDGDGC